MINFDEEECILDYDNPLAAMFIAMPAIIMLLAPLIGGSAVIYWWATTTVFATIGSHFG